LVEIGQVVREKKSFKENVNRRTDGRTDAGQIAMAIAHLS